MDARQVDFLNDVEADLAAPKPKSKVIKRLGALGSVLAAGTAFLTLSAAPAGAAQAHISPASAGPTDVRPLFDCYAPDRFRYDYTKGCGDGAYVKFHFVGENPCGPGGNSSILYFDRVFNSPCTGDVDLATVATSCA